MKNLGLAQLLGAKSIENSFLKGALWKLTTPSCHANIWCIDKIRKKFVELVGPQNVFVNATLH